ncbi:MAG: DUF5348 domain-containing protein [Hespellia sp.]|nr:DUF5348 domain-containing protein [Hespellia sp.]
MDEKRTGILFYNHGIKRYDIRFGLEEYYDGLQCGECFEVYTGKAWIPVRIETRSNGDGYLVGLPGVAVEGLTVRI